MATKMLKPKNGVQYCGYGECSGNKTLAVWREWNASPQFACEAHKDCLKLETDDGYMSLADEMTWGRL